MLASPQIERQEEPALNSVLIIEDDLAMGHLLLDILKREHYRAKLASTFQAGKELLASQSFSIILCDINLGLETGLELLPLAKQQAYKPLFILITGQAEVDSAIASIRDGAFDYLSKPDDLSELERQVTETMARALKRLQSRNSEAVLHKMHPKPTGNRLVGRSTRMVEVYRAMAKAALFRGSVLILGETGTGKELVARAIHENGPWQSTPFVAVNCGALTETLLESELFGHVRGAFTGAISHKRGLFEEAHGGTIFLDEIGDISAALQVKLLRVLQEGEIKPVGAVETKHVDVRVFAATHRDLLAEVKKGHFREDLYYRLKVFSVELPPLRDRIDDLPALIEHFIADVASKTSKRVEAISGEAMGLLKHYPWPGNVRELENVVVRAVASASSPVIFPEDLPSELTAQIVPPPKSGEAVAAASAPAVADSKPPTLVEMERNYILKVLRDVNYKKSKAAEILGIDRVTLYRKVARYGIPTPLRSGE